MSRFVPLDDQGLIAPLFALMGLWLLIGPAVICHYNHDSKNAWKASFYCMPEFLSRTLVLYIGFLISFFFLLLLMIKAFTDYHPDDPELPFLAYLIFGINILIGAYLFSRLWPVLASSFYSIGTASSDERSFQRQKLSEIWHWTANADSWFYCNLIVVGAFVSLVVLPSVSVIVFPDHALSFYLKFFIFTFSLPFFSWIIADRGVALKTAFEGKAGIF
jgi:hypothetical protein